VTGGSSVALDDVFTTTPFTKISTDISICQWVEVDTL
jgi:hypothetical protein